MSHTCNDGVHVFECDHKGCRRNTESEQGEQFQDAWEAAKAAGWANGISQGEWLHFCPEHA